MIADPNVYYSTGEDEATGSMLLDTSTGVNVDGYALTQSMRYSYAPNGCASQTITRNFMFPGDTHGNTNGVTVTEIWTELYVKFAA
ncbi:MAG TPA: hypothetical protein VEU07_00195, partial [Candidatus Acidoferrum sp.]|nr:hypothetical protein [Candidatus Acidoferrum sp.]